MYPPPSPANLHHYFYSFGHAAVSCGVQVSLSAYAYLFSELVQYAQTKVTNISKAEERYVSSWLLFSAAAPINWPSADTTMHPLLLPLGIGAGCGRWATRWVSECWNCRASGRRRSSGSWRSWASSASSRSTCGRPSLANAPTRSSEAPNTRTSVPALA